MRCHVIKVTNRYVCFWLVNNTQSESSKAYLRFFGEPLGDFNYDISYDLKGYLKVKLNPYLDFLNRKGGKFTLSYKCIHHLEGEVRSNWFWLSLHVVHHHFDTSAVLNTTAFFKLCSNSKISGLWWNLPVFQCNNKQIYYFFNWVTLKIQQ